MVKGCPSFNIFRIQQRMEDVFEEQIEHLTGALFRNTPEGKKNTQLLVLHSLLPGVAGQRREFLAWIFLACMFPFDVFALHPCSADHEEGLPVGINIGLD